MGDTRDTEIVCHIPLKKGKGGSLIDPEMSVRSAFCQCLLGDQACLCQDCQSEGGQEVSLASGWAGAGGKDLWEGHMEGKGTPQILLSTSLSPQGNLLYTWHLAGAAPPEFSSLMMLWASIELNFPVSDLPKQGQCLHSWREHLSALRPRQEEEEASGGVVGECAFGRHTKGSEGGNMSSSWICRTSSRATPEKPSRDNAT